MSIVDYQKGAKLSVERIFNNKNISDKNKSVLKKYLKIYNVSPARLAIFLSHITSLLEGTDDITKEMNDRDKIADLFNRIKNSKSKIYKKKICLSTYGTKVNGEIPKGFKDIKRVSVKKEKRDLSPKDMVTWEEAEQLMNATNSIQLKAIIAIQLDGGFRPSEFIDLNYGDVTIKDQFIVVEVKKGKTGRRNVILWRAVPYILRWCKAHPTKKPNDPLWVALRNLLTFII
jgi:integrase